MVLMKTVSLIFLLMMAMGSAAQAQEVFTSSGYESIDGDGTFERAIIEAVSKAINHCSPLQAEQVSEWNLRQAKAGYIFVAVASAEFICVSSGQ